jgi:hypothetical protein
MPALRFLRPKHKLKKSFIESSGSVSNPTICMQIFQFWQNDLGGRERDQAET